jgi:copper chaperone
METVTLRVPDVSCEHCVKTIDQTLSPLPGVEQVRTDLDTKMVTLTFDPAQTPLASIEEALDEAGYPVAH